MNPRIVSNNQGNWSILMSGETKAVGNYPLSEAIRIARMNGATEPIQVEQEQPTLEPLTA